jgi:hypothetical protein
MSERWRVAALLALAITLVALALVALAHECYGFR